jgi:polyphosphate kinase
MSENIEAISIVDNYLEHSRVYIFWNAGQTEVYISSADFMTLMDVSKWRVNLRSRNKNELIDNFDIGWKGMLRRVIIRIN